MTPFASSTAPSSAPNSGCSVTSVFVARTSRSPRQPQVVPPRHRDEIAEPLVRRLVRDDARDADLLGERRDLVVDEQRPSRNVIAPAFSIAPDWKSGTAIRSSFGNGNGMPKYFPAPR